MQKMWGMKNIKNLLFNATQATLRIREKTGLSENMHKKLLQLLQLASMTDPITGKLRSLEDREYFIRLNLMIHAVGCPGKMVITERGK
jgi:hypothetical protein